MAAVTPQPPEPALPPGAIAVEMLLVPGLDTVESSPPTLRSNLTDTPPADGGLVGLPPGKWSYGRAALTQDTSVPFAISANRDELWFDGDRDGVLTPKEHRQGARIMGNSLWHDGLETWTQREIDGAVRREPVLMAVGSIPRVQAALTRLDCHREGVLKIGDRSVKLASIDRTHRGWFGHGTRDLLMVDTDGDGSFETSVESHERYKLGEPIPVGDSDYRATDFGTFGERLTFTPSDRPARRMASLAIGDPAPDFSGVSMDGSPVRLSANRGSWVLVDFWATWCGPCLKELPHLRDLKLNHPELVVLGVSGDRQRPALEAFLARTPLPWPQIYDERAPIRGLYRVASLPTSYLIAPDGTIAAKNLRGAGLDQRFKREVERWERAAGRAAAGTSEGG